MGGDYVILRGSEVQFMSVHPLHVAIFDLKRNRSADVYPYTGDRQHRQFSGRLKPLISEKWCVQFNAQCDPDNFDTDLRGDIAVNEAAQVFGFEAQFDAAGFGDAAERQVPPLTVVYVFRQRKGRWEHREFEGRELQRLLRGGTLKELIAKTPDLPFR